MINMKFFPYIPVLRSSSAPWSQCYLGLIYSKVELQPTSEYYKNLIEAQIYSLSKLCTTTNIPDVSSFKDYKALLKNLGVPPQHYTELNEQQIVSAMQGKNITPMNQLEAVNFLFSLEQMRSITTYDLDKIDSPHIHFRLGYLEESFPTPCGGRQSLHNVPLLADDKTWLATPMGHNHAPLDYCSKNILTVIWSFTGIHGLLNQLMALSKYQEKHMPAQTHHTAIVHQFPTLIEAIMPPHPINTTYNLF